MSATPAANASLAEAPDELALTFSEPVDPASARVRLLDPQQSEVAGVGHPAVDEAGTVVAASLPDLEEGIYTVDYQVTSAVDGHVTNGIFAFLIDPSGTQPAPAVPSQTSSPSSDLDVVAARWLALAAALAAAGIVLFWLLTARAALLEHGVKVREADAPWGAIAVAALLALVALVVHLVLAARPIVEAGGAAAGWFPLDPVGPYGGTQFAVAMRTSLAGLLAATFLAAGRATLPVPDRAWLASTLAALLVALAGMSFAGHAAALGGAAFALVDLVHLVAVATWLGALVGLVLLVARHRAAAGLAVQRHSRIALIAAPVVLLTGIANSPLVLGDRSRDLVGSGYGNLLLGKALLLSVAVGIGAANFMLGRSGRGRRVTLALIGSELLVAGTAVLVAAGMVTGQPAAGRPPQLIASAIGTAHLYGTAGDSTVHAAINLPSPGEQRYQVSVANVADGAYRTDVLRVFLVFSPPVESGLPSERVQLEPADEPWVFAATGAYTPIVGTWQVQVIVRREGQLDEGTSFPLPVVEPRPPEQLPPPDTGIGVPGVIAALWTIVPGGVAAWLASVVALGLAAGLFAWGRGRPYRRPLAWIRAAVVGVALLIGVAAGSRAVVDAANAPPPAAATTMNPVEATTDSIAAGLELYLANCASCHGLGGAGDGPAADELAATPRPLSDAVPTMEDGEIAYRIAAGTVGTQMPPFAATLSQSDRWNLVNYLRSRWPRSP